MQWRISEVIDWLLADRRERLAYRYFLHALNLAYRIVPAATSVCQLSVSLNFKSDNG